MKPLAITRDKKRIRILDVVFLVFLWGCYSPSNGEIGAEVSSVVFVDVVVVAVSVESAAAPPAPSSNGT